MLLNNAISLREAGASDWAAVEALPLANMREAPVADAGLIVTVLGCG